MLHSMLEKPLTSFAICVAIVSSAAQLVFTAEQKEGFSPPKGCLCPGENLRFECIIEGGGITVWNGTLLTCPPTNDIPISHHTFREGEERNISVKCNHDSVTASLRYWRVVNSSDYYSQVNVSREVNSSSLNGSTVTCAHDDGSVVTVVSSWKIVDPLSSPVNVHLEQANKTYLTFSWDPQFPLCPSLRYRIHTKHCGSCPSSVDSATFMCKNVGVTTDIRACSVAVQARCGNMVGNLSDIFQVMLKVPDAPLVEILPIYSFPNGKMLSLNVTLSEVVQVPLFTAPSMPDVSSLSYTIFYSDATTNVRCGPPVTIDVSSCQYGACSHIMFEVSNSSCNNYSSTGIAVTAYATNIFGDGHQSQHSFIGHSNNFVDIKFDNIGKTVTCVFPDDPTRGLKSCKANITYGTKCESQSGIYESRVLGDSVTIQLLNLTERADYCFSIRANNGTMTVLLQGRFDINNHLAGIIAGPVIAAIVIGLVVAVLVIYWLHRRHSTSGTSHRYQCIEFHVGDQPGCLNKAVKVFVDGGINITFVDTCPPYLDNLSMRCFRISYESCKDSRFNKLKRNLEKVAKCVKKVREDQQQQTFSVVVRFSVRDKRGALKKVLNILEGKAKYADFQVEWLQHIQAVAGNGATSGWYEYKVNNLPSSGT